VVNPREDTTIQSCFSPSLKLPLSLSTPPTFPTRNGDLMVFLDAFSCLLCCIWEEKRKSDCWKLSEYDQSLNEEIVPPSDGWRRETPMFMGLLLDYFYCYSSSWWISEPVTAAADKGVKEKREGGMLWYVCASPFLFLHLDFLIPRDPVSQLICGYKNYFNVYRGN